VQLLKRLLIVFILISSIFVALAPAWAFQNEPKTFRGIKWGTNISELSDMIFHAQQGESKVYFREKDQLIFGDADLLHIWYFFSNDRLYSVVINFEQWSNFNSLKTELFEIYGLGHSPNRFKEEYRWVGSDVVIFFDYNELREEGKLSYYYLPIMKENLNSEKQKAEKSNDDL